MKAGGRALFPCVLWLRHRFDPESRAAVARCYRHGVNFRQILLGPTWRALLELPMLCRFGVFPAECRRWLLLWAGPLFLETWQVRPAFHLRFPFSWWERVVSRRLPAEAERWTAQTRRPWGVHRLRPAGFRARSPRRASRRRGPRPGPPSASARSCAV